MNSVEVPNDEAMKINIETLLNFPISLQLVYIFSSQFDEYRNYINDSTIKSVAKILDK